MNIIFKMLFHRWLLLLVCLSLCTSAALGQEKTAPEEEGLGPVVTAYLGYLRNEQEVVDDRVSRKEISRSYYRRNSNRIRALREMALRIARESKDDYLPELEAVAADEMGTLLEHPPSPARLRVGEVLNFTLRYLGLVRMGDNFYLFARLDPYEQAELKEKAAGDPAQQPVKSPSQPPQKGRPRRVHSRK
jgi:hypothetical protein